MVKDMTIKDLRDELLLVFDLARKDRLQSDHVKNVVSVANAALKSCVCELKYAELRNEVPSIPFLGKGAELKQMTAPKKKQLKKTK